MKNIPQFFAIAFVKCNLFAIRDDARVDKAKFSLVLLLLNGEASHRTTQRRQERTAHQQIAEHRTTPPSCHQHTHTYRDHDDDIYPGAPAP